jgi:hypothetical protein
MTPVEIVENAVKEYGRPDWVAHVPSDIVSKLHTADLVRILATGEPSTGPFISSDIFAVEKIKRMVD